LFASALPASATPAYPALYVFGGSLSDVGNGYIINGGASPVPPYYDGTFSNGPLWIEDYAAHFDLPTPTPALDGGDDFAVAGAQTGATDISTNAFDLPEQLATFESQVPDPVAGALYSIEIGANDLDKILDTGAPIPTLEAMVAQSVQAEVAVIADLAGRGATNFLLPNVPDLGKAPRYNTDSVTASDVTNLTAYYNATAESALVPLAIDDHLNIDIVDTYSLVDQVVADPSGYGFNNVTDPVWSGNSFSSNSGTLAESTQAGQDTYLFWDQLHPTASGQALIAASAENLVFR
jgi:outer membrane lipase/esterase